MLNHSIRANDSLQLHSNLIFQFRAPEGTVGAFSNMLVRLKGLSFTAGAYIALNQRNIANHVPWAMAIQLLLAGLGFFFGPAAGTLIRHLGKTLVSPDWNLFLTRNRI
jgi:hypothetical protein